MLTLACIALPPGLTHATDDPSCRGTFVYSFYPGNPCTGGQVARLNSYEWWNCDGQPYATIYTSNGQTCSTLLDPGWAQYAGQTPTSILSQPSCTTAMPGPLVASTCGGKGQPKAECPLDPGSARGAGTPSQTKASGDAANLAGDPVDLTTGQLQWTPTDLDLGGGLRFARHYASGRAQVRSMGKAWVHALDWSATRQTTAAGGTTVVTIRPPFGDALVFIESALGSMAFVTGAPGAGTLSIDGAQAIHYTAADGTEVVFGATGGLQQIRPIGALPITVATDGSDPNKTNYTNGAQTLSVTVFGSGTNAGRVSTVTRVGEAWTYGYDSSQNLTTVTGPDPTNSAATISWTYAYQNPLTIPLLTSVSRSDLGTPLATWSWASSRVESADEPALEQTLSLTYASAASNQLTTTVKDGQNRTLGVLNTQDGVIGGITTPSGPVNPVAGAVNPVPGGPGLPVPFATGTKDGVARWRTKTDKNGNVTLYDGHDARSNPLRIIEGWVDDGGVAGQFDAGDHFAKRRDTVWHPTFATPILVTETSTLTGLFEKTTTYDYDAPGSGNPALANEAPTSLLGARIVHGKKLDASGASQSLDATTLYTYDAVGHVLTVVGPGPKARTEYAYDAQGHRTSVRRSLNGSSGPFLETLFSNFDARGNPQTVTDPNGLMTLFTYDIAGRVKTVKPPYSGAGDSTIAFTYDVDGNLVRVDFPKDTFNQDSFLRLGYDPKNRITFLADAQANAIVYEYTGGRATREALYAGFVDLSNRGLLKGDAEFGYDQAGRLVSAFNPLFADDSVKTSFGHDGNGNPTSIADENGRQDSLVYDALDRLTQVAQIRTATYTTAFQYDPLSDVTRVTDPAAKNTDYRYDDLGRLVEVASPDTGTTRYLYDAAGNLTTKVENATGASPRVTQYEYDGLDRLTWVDLPNDPDWLFTYDTSATLNQKGRLASVTNGMVTTELTYTDRGQLAKEATITGGKRYEVVYGYDAAGSRTLVRTPGGVGAVTRFAGVRPKELDVTADGTTHTIRDIAFLPFGPRTQAKLPPFDSASGQNAVVSTRTYDLRYQVTEIDVTGPGGVMLDRTYTWNHTAGAPGPTDPGPNLDRVVDHRDASESHFYFHDELDRLWKATDLSGSALFTYGYDAAGNRTSETTSAGTTTYSYVANTGKLLSASGTNVRTFAHDAYGSRTCDTAGGCPFPRFVYDDANRLMRVQVPSTGATQTTYAYDAFGRRVAKTSSIGLTTLFFYDPAGHLLEQVTVIPTGDDFAQSAVWLEDEPIAGVARYKETGTPASLPPGIAWAMPSDPMRLAPWLAAAAGSVLLLGWLPALRRPRAALVLVAAGLASQSVECTPPPAGSFFWIHTDHLRTPIAMSDTPATASAAKVVWRAKHDPFGQATVNPDPDGDGTQVQLDLRFPGQVYDAETGLHYNYFRTYDPRTGRYLEADPIGQAGDINQYTYVRSQPGRLLDPAGLEARIACYRCRNSAGPMVCLVQEDGSLIDAFPTNGGTNAQSKTAGDEFGESGPLPPDKATLLL